jgi:hypothetical protein
MSAVPKDAMTADELLAWSRGNRAKPADLSSATAELSTWWRSVSHKDNSPDSPGFFSTVASFFSVKQGWCCQRTTPTRRSRCR